MSGDVDEARPLDIKSSECGCAARPTILEAAGGLPLAVENPASTMRMWAQSGNDGK